jgi:hypothetical protein
MEALAGSAAEDEVVGSEVAAWAETAAEAVVDEAAVMVVAAAGAGAVMAAWAEEASEAGSAAD